jgi:hypothetical protein
LGDVAACMVGNFVLGGPDTGSRKLNSEIAQESLSSVWPS